MRLRARDVGKENKKKKGKKEVIFAAFFEEEKSQRIKVVVSGEEGLRAETTSSNKFWRRRVEVRTDFCECALFAARTYCNPLPYLTLYYNTVHPSNTKVVSTNRPCRNRANRFWYARPPAPGPTE